MNNNKRKKEFLFMEIEIDGKFLQQCVGKAKRKRQQRSLLRALFLLSYLSSFCFWFFINFFLIKVIKFSHGYL